MRKKIELLSISTIAETALVLGGLVLNGLGNKVFGEKPENVLGQHLADRDALFEELDDRLSRIPEKSPIPLPPASMEL